MSEGDASIAAQALQERGQVESLDLAPQAPAVAAKLEDWDAGVRHGAIQALDPLGPSHIAEHAAALVARLQDRDRLVRRTALQVLTRLEPQELSLYADAITAKLWDPYREIRLCALKALKLMEPAQLAPHVDVLAASAQDWDTNVCNEALRVLMRLDAEHLGPHASTVASKLQDCEPGIRCGALQVLQCLDPSLSAPHADAVADVLNDRDSKVSNLANHLLAKMGQPQLALPAPGESEALAQVAFPGAQRSATASLALVPTTAPSTPQTLYRNSDSREDLSPRVSLSSGGSETPSIDEDVDSVTMRTWLESKRLGRYFDTFERQGYDDVEFLLQAEPEDITELIQVCKMPTGHANHFKRSLEELRRSPPDAIASLDAASAR